LRRRIGQQGFQRATAAIREIEFRDDLNDAILFAYLGLASQ
jgi:hypothetical protein